MKKGEVKFRKVFSKSLICNTSPNLLENLKVFKQRAMNSRKLYDILRFSDTIISFIEHCGGIKVFKKHNWRKTNLSLWEQLKSDVYTWILLMQFIDMQDSSNSWALIFYEYMYEGNTIQWDSFTYKSIPLYYELLSFMIDFLPHELYSFTENLCLYFEKHSIDPYGCVLNQKPVQKILDKCLQGLPNDIDLHSPFTSSEIENNNKLSSRKDNTQCKYHALLLKIIRWSTLKSTSLSVAVKQTASLIRGVNNVKSGELILVNTKDNEWVYARVAVDPTKLSSILVYLTPDESQITTIGMDKILPIPSSIIQEYFHVEDCNKLQNCVENYLDNIYQNFTNISKEQAIEYLKENNIDTQLLELVSKGQFALQHEKELKLIFKTLSKTLPNDKILQVKQIISDIISENINKLKQAPKYSIFPFLFKATIKQLESFDCEFPFIEICLNIKSDCKLGLIKLANVKSDILSGKTKNKIVDKWLDRINIKVDKFLTQYGFIKDALPHNYLDQPPSNISNVKNNQVILHRIIDSYRIGIDHFKLQELIDYLCSSTYNVVDSFINNICYCISSYIDISINDLPSDTKSLLSLIESSNLDNNLQLQLEGIIKDKEYLENMKRMETDKEFAKDQYMVTVPISGLIISELCRLENEHVSSLNIWEPGLIAKQSTSNLSSLENAVVNDNIKELEKILSCSNVYVNESDESGLTPLHISCSFINNNPRLSSINYLLDYDETDINAVNNTGNTAFHFYARIKVEESIQSKYYDVLLKFIQKSPTIIHSQNHMGETPLHQAIVFSNIPTIRYLLDNNADPNFANKKGNTAIHYAVNTGNIECVSLILKYNGNHTLNNDLKESAIDIAFKLKNIPILQLLLETKWTEDKKQKANKQSEYRRKLAPQIQSDIYTKLLGNSVPKNILDLTKDISKNKISYSPSTNNMNIYWNTPKKSETLNKLKQSQQELNEILIKDKSQGPIIKIEKNSNSTRWVSPKNPKHTPLGNYTTNKKL